MSDLFFGQTCTEAYKFVSAGTAHTFTFNFDADKVVFNNLTQWEQTAGNLPISVWFKDQTTAAHAYQHQVIDSNAASSFNFLDTAAAGFTDAGSAASAPAYRALISGVSQANPCVVTTSAAHGYQTNQIVRITDLGEVGPNATDRGMNELDGNRYRIVVINTTSFSLKDVITDDPINSISFVAWVSGGRVDLESRVITLNNPQVSPYSSTNPYNPTPFAYNAATYALTADTAVMGDDSDVFLIEVYKFGQVYDLGDLLT